MVFRICLINKQNENTCIATEAVKYASFWSMTNNVRTLLNVRSLVGVLRMAGTGEEGLLAELGGRRVRWMQASKTWGA